jgi:DNA-binding response OmpR family regulator
VRPRGPIVIHEEDAQIRELLVRWLGEARYAVIEGGAEPQPGIAPSLVIADVASPRGGEARIESLRAVYAAPILVLSGRFRRGLGGSKETARRLGVRKVLPKPFTRKELLSAVAESLEAPA